MKKIIALSLSLIFIAAVSGCQSTKTRAVEGALIGAVVGAGAGYGIGHASGHHGGEGAGIGAAAGALTGAFVGSQIDKPQNEQPAQTGGAYNPSQMSMAQIVELSKQGINEDVIIDKIRLTNSRFTLSPADISSLQQQGVSDKVISAMQGL
ncbi:MAG: glycine zipper domain-containing protein [Candidatus Omnitrophica bacterium]|nr:glycine zipper domain-containing protein [Candidatus Omnitrophota bacterium]